MKVLLSAIMALTLLIGNAWAATKPNIVFIFVDDWGYGDASGSLAGVPLPGIDAIAAAGVTFTDGYATASTCAPSRAGALLGIYQQRIGLYGNPVSAIPAEWPSSFGLPAGGVTVAQSLQQAGYVTAMYGKWHIGKRADQHPMRRGFDEFLGMISTDHPYFGEMAVNPVLRGYTPEPQGGYLTDALAREAASFIQRRAARPFFIYFAPNAVHTPYEAKPAILATLSHITNTERRLFSGALISLSEAVGTIVAALKAAGVYDSTLIVLAGDNGGVHAGRTKPLRGRKGNLYEGGIRVPFFASWPDRLVARTTYRQPVSILDLFPTFLAAAGGTAPANLDGINLLPYLTTSQAQPARHLYWGNKSRNAVRRGDWKLLVTGTTRELYNLATDKSEARNVAAANPTIVADLNRARAAWVASLPAPQ